MPNKRHIESILFVDDESAFLDALQARLASLGGRWHMAFSTGGDDALQQLEDDDFSVVVSDIDNRYHP